MKCALIHCGQLVTVAGPSRSRARSELNELAIIPDGAIVWEGGVITSVGPTESLRDQIATAEQVWDAEGKVVTPGLVDAHTHLAFAGNRIDEFEMRARGASYVEISEAGGGIQQTVRQTRAASEVDLLAQAQRHADWMIANGTTTAEAKSGYGLSLESELKILRVIHKVEILQVVPTFLGAHTVPAEYRSNPEDYIDLLVDTMLPTVRQENLADWCDIFCESIAFSPDQSRRILTRAKELGFKLRMHVDQLTSGSGAQLAAELGAKTADHLELVKTAGIQALAHSKVMPVLLPGSVYALGHNTYPPVLEMIEAGLPIVLATDFNPGSSPTPSLPMIMSLACTHMGMTPAQALAACTVNAAYSLDLGHQIGSLEPGKRADFVQWGYRDFREIAYYFGVHAAEQVFISGTVQNFRSQFAT